MTPNEQKAYEKLIDEMQNELFKVASNDTSQNFNDRLNNQRSILERYILQARADERRRIGEMVETLKKDTVCLSEECKRVSYPICRHKMGYNDALEELLSRINKE